MCNSKIDSIVQSRATFEMLNIGFSLIYRNISHRIIYIGRS